MQADDILHNFDKGRIGEEPGGIGQLRPQAEGAAPDPLNGNLPHAVFATHCKGAPVRDVVKSLLRVSAAGHSTASSLMLRGAPERGAPMRPSFPFSSTGRHRRAALCRVTPNAEATPKFVVPGWA